ncbi:batten s disease protein cln3 [Ceraceosorus bombacis]|uniref:Protein BTN n=1 Tax=Ceraceosorus bombacis TaxID=401625 RepID=A0A0P1BMG2_9BASI|nr:batten s disease protein cln3 [Ceraceosorus bombacis]
MHPYASPLSPARPHAHVVHSHSPSDSHLPLTRTRFLFRLSNFLFGLLNNALYVVILTAALELLPRGVPTGVVAAANIAPALVAKAIWPYVLKGEIRYARRVVACSTISFVGMILIAFSTSLENKLIGISMASFSSGLGELTFLQLNTRYGHSGAGDGVGWFASGTGAAGLLGAAAWWIVRPLGVKGGLTLLSILPGIMALAYFAILPSKEALDAEVPADYTAIGTQEADADFVDGEEEDDDARPRATGAQGHQGDPEDLPTSAAVSVPFARKMQLIKPMLLVYIAPLVLVYFFEYTINQGVASTLLYPLPDPREHWILSLFVKKLSDYYPLYQLTYQTFVFLSRSSISILRLPAIPQRLLWIPAILQGLLLAILISESLSAWFPRNIASPLVIVLVCLEGLAGGSAYVSVFYQLSRDSSNSLDKSTIGAADGESSLATESEQERRTRLSQEHEFRIGSIGLADSFGILIAALVSMPLELWLCGRQVAAGRLLCKEVKAAT